jgi:hypothetical protein
MDSSQKKAFSERVNKTFSVVSGTPGSGKSMMAAAFCELCLKGGEIILVVGISPVAVRELFAQTISSAKRQDITDSLIDIMSCTEAVPEILDSCDLVFHEIVEATSILSLKDEPQQSYLNQRPLTSKRNYSKTRALFTTFERINDIVAQDFCPTVLICDDAENARDHFVFAACGKFESSLKREALFGNQERYPLKLDEQERNHLRSQFRMTTMEQLILTGIQPLSLNTQYNKQHGTAAWDPKGSAPTANCSPI